MKKFTSAMLASMTLITSNLAQACDYNANILPTAPAERFILNADGTAVDKLTGLMWSRCTLGMQWDEKEQQCIDADDNWFSWDEAIRDAEQSEYASYNDWRVPNIKELASIVESACSRPALNTEVFNNIHPSAQFHSATPAQAYQTQAWYVNQLGQVSAFNKTDVKRVLLVRQQNIL